jgi:hypothetical protein
MSLLGQGFEDPRSAAVMALAGGLLRGDFGGGLLGANQAYAQSQEGAFKKRLGEMQIKNYESEIAARGLAAEKEARKNKLIEGLLGAGAPMSAGAFAPSSDGMGPVMPQSAAPVGGGLANMNINQIAALKLAGVDLGDLYKFSQTPQEFKGGSIYRDPVTGAERTIPKLPEGMTMDGGRAGFVPGFAGAQVDLEAQRQAAIEAAKASQDLVTVTGPDGIPRFVTRASITQPQQTPARQPSMQVTPGQQRGADVERIRILQQELQNPALAPADRQAITNELQRTQTAQVSPGFPQSLGAQAGLSPQQSAQAKALETAATQKEMTGARQAEARAKDVKTATQFLQIANQAEALLKEGPTASGIGSAVDAAAAVFGKSTRGAELAQQLKALGGWLVANVPRMEGPQSNFDVGNYQTMAADVANDRLPAERRLAALQSIKDMMNSTITGKPIERGIGKVQPYEDPEKERRYQEYKNRSGQ